ncbi:MAG: MotA/TolQ/ExbB proton channel family protein [Syntrophotalea sp.]|jgi:biopolymer transport protein ExbB/TolQ|uniref:MotA/TolQ/ExbB proton channel family protein n=1 Tax=Syntrophotalea sp. TaxID=2812029 RepID=UPI003D12B53F
MAGQESIFNVVSNGIIDVLTYTINSYSGLLQILVYLIMASIFGFALVKSYQSFRALSFYDFSKVKSRRSLHHLTADIKMPLALLAASFFVRTKLHYEQEQQRGTVDKVIPPDAFIRDAAFQFSERYFEEKFLEPVAMMANLMPPMGFIGTIIGMVVHFLANSGTLNTEITVAGIATALYTTFIALICFTFLEFLRKVFYALAHRRIDEGLSAITLLADDVPGDRG